MIRFTAMGASPLRAISIKGGLARIALHGNPGTKDGRILGGLRSIVTHTLKPSGFKTILKIRKPKHSAKLAELMGILMGDGHVGVYQASVATSSETDSEHAYFVAELFGTIFGIHPTVTKRANKNVLTIVLSSKMACSHLVALGMPQGNKLKMGLYPPTWIINNPAYAAAFVRGLIDTDGCVYEDRHIIKGKTYTSTCIAFTSASSELLDYLQEFLISRAISATRWGRHVRIRRKKDVAKYAQEIGFSNPKHARKIGV